MAWKTFVHTIKANKNQIHEAPDDSQKSIWPALYSISSPSPNRWKCAFHATGSRNGWLSSATHYTNTTINFYWFSTIIPNKKNALDFELIKGKLEETERKKSKSWLLRSFIAERVAISVFSIWRTHRCSLAITRIRLTFENAFARRNVMKSSLSLSAEPNLKE